eukprot:4336023-Amphidinium_carterae.1
MENIVTILGLCAMFGQMHTSTRGFSELAYPLYLPILTHRMAERACDILLQAGLLSPRALNVRHVPAHTGCRSFSAGAFLKKVGRLTRTIRTDGLHHDCVTNEWMPECWQLTDA